MTDAAHWKTAVVTTLANISVTSVAGLADSVQRGIPVLHVRYHTR